MYIFHFIIASLECIGVGSLITGDFDNKLLLHPGDADGPKFFTVTPLHICIVY